jgi:c-di-GMP-binding flagellar brake protein YcgR
VSTFVWEPDRRHSPRIDLLVAIRGDLMALNEAARVMQLSAHGMMVETTVPLSPRDTHEFRLSLTGHPLQVKTRVVHSRMAVDRDDVTYVSGLEFIDLDEGAASEIASFIAQAEAAQRRDT